MSAQKAKTIGAKLLEDYEFLVKECDLDIASQKARTMLRAISKFQRGDYSGGMIEAGNHTEVAQMTRQILHDI